MQTQILNEFVRIDPKVRLNQADILKDLSIVIQSGIEDGKAVLSVIALAYAIVINQECDLEQDYNSRQNPDSSQDKFIPNILILPAYLSNQLKEGTHRGEKFKGQVWSKDLFKNIVQNNSARFHSIKSNEQFQIPDLIIDFKHLYTISRDVIYKDIPRYYLASICEIYRENISHRYSHYLSRIGLPDRTP